MTPDAVREKDAGASSDVSNAAARVSLGQWFRNADRMRRDRRALTELYRRTIFQSAATDTLRESAWSRGREGEIDAVYTELRALCRLPPTPDHEAAYKSKLARLRELERAETERMQAAFHARIAADRKAVDDAERRAEELLAQHERPSSGH